MLPRPALPSVLPLLLVLLPLAACAEEPAGAPPVELEPSEEAGLDPAVLALVRTHVARVRAAPSDAARHGSLGLVYEANELWPEAAAAFAHAAELAPAEPLWRLHRAIALRETGDDAGALALLAEVTADPGAASTATRASAWHRYGRTLLEEGRLDEAAAAFRETLALAPDLPVGDVGLAEVFLAREAWDAARASAEAALVQAPDYKPAHFALGLALRGLGRPEEAERQLRLGLEARTFHVDDDLAPELSRYRVGYAARINRAADLMDQGQAALAAQVLEKLVAERPDDATALASLGQAYVRMGELERAEEVLARARELAPGLFAPHLYLSTCALEGGRAEEALAHAGRAVALAPEVADAHFARARALARLERFPEAYTELRRTVELDPTDPMVHVALGEQTAILGRYEEARLHFETAMAKAPGFLPAHVSHVGMLLRLERLDEAAAAFEVLRELAPEHPRVLQLAERLRALGALEE